MLNINNVPDVWATKLSKTWTHLERGQLIQKTIIINQCSECKDSKKNEGFSDIPIPDWGGVGVPISGLRKYRMLELDLKSV